MIRVYYAHKPEVAVLKRLVAGADWSDRVSWQRHDRKNDNLGTAALVVNVGFAGSLADHLDLGEIVLVSPPQPPESAERFAAASGLRTAKCHTSRGPVLNKNAAASIRDETKADIVDMEWGHLTRAARAGQIELVGFKLVSDRCTPEARLTIDKNLADWSTKLGATVFEFLSGLQ